MVLTLPPACPASGFALNVHPDRCWRDSRRSTWTARCWTPVPLDDPTGLCPTCKETLR